jgi:hypothetical protein
MKTSANKRIYRDKINRQNEIEAKHTMPRYELCAGCGSYHALMPHAKVMIQMPHKPCTQTS